MGEADRRRSARHALGHTAEIHIGPKTVLGVVQDVSKHGMGLVMPGDVDVEIGGVIWVLVESVASYAITGTVRRVTAEGVVGIEFEEVLYGDAEAAVDQLPLIDPDETQSLES